MTEEKISDSTETVRIIPEGERRKDYDILREKHKQLL